MIFTFGHNGDTFGVNSAQIGILKKTNQVSLGSFLKKIGKSVLMIATIETTLPDR